jgi:thioredoxin 1
MKGPINISLKSVLLFIICMVNILAILGNGSDSAADKTDLASPEHVWEFPDAPVSLDDSSLDSALKRYSPFVLECWKYDCSPCQLIRSTIDEMAIDLRGRVVFGRLCINENPVTTKKYEVSRGPTLLIFNRGTLIYKHVGNYPKPTLEKIILDRLMLY